MSLSTVFKLGMLACLMLSALMYVTLPFVTKDYLAKARLFLEHPQSLYFLICFVGFTFVIGSAVLLSRPDTSRIVNLMIMAIGTGFLLMRRQVTLYWLARYRHDIENPDSVVQLYENVSLVFLFLAVILGACGIRSRS